MSALCASLVAPQSDSSPPVPEVQESLLGSPTADGPPGEEHSPGREGTGPRCINQKVSGPAEPVSFANALEMLRGLKAKGRSWTEMGHELQRQWGVHLDKDQLKALVR